MIAHGIHSIPLYTQILVRHALGRCVYAKFALAAFACLGVAEASASATTYYVSPSGSDSNNGTSTSTPWQTIAKVNSAHFAAGDSVLFLGSGTFTGALVFSYATNVPSSSSTNAITVGSYGSGAAEILSNTSGPSSAAITVNGVNGIKITGLTLLGGGGTSPTTWIGACIINQSGKSISGVTIDQCDISNFTGTNWAQTAEVYVSGYYGALDTISITNNQLHGANGVKSSDNNGIYGVSNGQNITHVTYSANTIYNLGGLTTNNGGGIVANGVNGGILEYNIAHDIGANSTSCGGPAGIWAYNSNNVTIQYNEAYNVQPTAYQPGACDWDAYDLDGGVTNSIVQYNYSHDNAGAAWATFMSGTWGNNTIRYNISENDDNVAAAGGVLLFSSGLPTSPIYVYNNTIYTVKPTSTKAYPAAIYDVYSPSLGARTWPAGSMVINNIICDDVVTGNGNTQYVDFTNTISGLTIDNNIYYAAASRAFWSYQGKDYFSLSDYQKASGQETHSVVANPLLTAPGTGGTLSWTPSSHSGPQPNPSGYKLSANSPAINAGATAPGASRDYYGAAVPNGDGKSNIGADAASPPQ